MEELRVGVGGAMSLYHSDIKGDEPCEPDPPSIEAHDRDAYG